VHNSRRVSDKELERAFGIPMITTEFVELLVRECVTEGVSANFCTIDGIPRLFLVFNP